MEIYSKSIKGTDRLRNEDSIAVEAASGGGFILALADGIGGRECGHIASQTVTAALVEYFKRLNNVIEALRYADSVLRETNSKGNIKSGCTVATAYLFGNELHYTWQGNVRIFLNRKGNWICLTKDHILHIGYGEYRICRCLKGEGIRNDIPYNRLAIEVGDSILVCSDGYHNFFKNGLPDIESLPDYLSRLVPRDDASYILVRNLQVVISRGLR